MKIIIVTSEIGTDAGGLALTCLQLKNFLEELKHEVKIIKSVFDNTYYTLDGGYDPELGNKIRLSQNLKEVINKLKIEFSPDLIIAYGAGKNSYITSIIAEKLNKSFYVVLCGSDINLSFASPEILYYNEVSLKKAERIIALSYELKENSKFFLKSDEKIFVIPNGFNFKKNNLVKKKVLTNKITFGTGSTFLSEKKGISNLLISFSKYIKNYAKDDKLILYGKIDADIKKQYEKIIEDNKLKNNVELCGYLDREEYHKKMGGIDIYIQLSPFEGCCNSIGEAIINKKYILISNTGYFAEVLREKHPEIIIEDLTPEKIAQRLYEYSNYILRNDNREEIIKELKEKISKNNIIKKWEELILEKVKKIDDKEVPYIVMFHDINSMYTGIDYSPTGFKNLISIIAKKGYRLCSYKEYITSNNKENLIICTFDDGYEGVYKNAFPIMSKYNFTGTVFICPDLIGKSNDWNRRDEVLRYQMTEEMLDNLYKAGWEIGSHGMGHYNMLRLSQTELEYSLENSKKILEKKYGKIISFCYPFGNYKPYIKSLVAKYYDVAFSVDIGGTNWKYDKYQLKRLVPEELKKILMKG